MPVPAAWLKITRANHVWATDITYIPMAQGWVCISRYIECYNTRRPHSTLDRQTPDEFYFASA